MQTAEPTSIVSQSVTNNRCAPSRGGHNRKVGAHQKNSGAGIVPPPANCFRCHLTLRIETSQFDDQKDGLRWFGHVEQKDDNDWVKRCITWEAEGIRQRGWSKKTWWDCVKNDTES